MPIAVMMESSENTRSITTSCATTSANDCVACAGGPSPSSLGFDFAVNFARGLGDQEQAAADQDDVAP